MLESAVVGRTCGCMVSSRVNCDAPPDAIEGSRRRTGPSSTANDVNCVAPGAGSLSSKASKIA